MCYNAHWEVISDTSGSNLGLAYGAVLPTSALLCLSAGSEHLAQVITLHCS